MAVSLLPLLMSILLLAVPFVLGIYGRKKACKIAIVCSSGIVAAIVLYVYLPGWLLMAKATRGDASAQYELAKWHENHSESIGTVLLWPARPNVMKGYYWLAKAAEQENPPALYALGVRLKYGIHVPKPDGWKGPAGNHFPQPAQGQAYINRAIELGYQPIGAEKDFYWHVFRERT